MDWYCGIYDDRPEVCREYPTNYSFVPSSCGFHFPGDGKRHGKCLPECDASCCKLARQYGEPGGTPMPEILDGLPCKHLEYKEDYQFAPHESSDTTVIEVDGDPIDQPDDIRDEE